MSAVKSTSPILPARFCSADGNRYTKLPQHYTLCDVSTWGPYRATAVPTAASPGKVTLERSTESQCTRLNMWIVMLMYFVVVLSNLLAARNPHTTYHAVALEPGLSGLAVQVALPMAKRLFEGRAQNKRL